MEGFDATTSIEENRRIAAAAPLTARAGLIAGTLPLFSVQSNRNSQFARSQKAAHSSCERLLCGLFRRRWRKHFRSTARLGFRLGLGSFLGFLLAFVLVSHAASLPQIKRQCTGGSEQSEAPQLPSFFPCTPNAPGDRD